MRRRRSLSKPLPPFTNTSKTSPSRRGFIGSRRITAWTCCAKKKRQKTDSLDSLLEQKGDHLEDLAARTADLGRRIEEKEEKVQLALRVLSYVSPEQRQILILRELDGLSYEEISAVLHCSLDAVKARLKRARQQLQEKARHFLEQRSFR